MSEPEIALVFTAEPWVEELHRYLSDHGGARVRRGRLVFTAPRIEGMASAANSHTSTSAVGKR